MMRSQCLATALLCGGLLTLPAWAADKKDIDGDKLPAGQFTGKLVGSPGSDGSFTLDIDIQHLAVRNPKAARNEVQQILRDQQQIERLQSQIAHSRNANEYRQRVHQLAGALQHQQAEILRQQLRAQENVVVVTDHKEIDFHTDEHVKVRILHAPTAFDDKGNPKKYTKDELKELKGKDAELPGYESTMSSLTAGQIIQVTLGHHAPVKDEDKDDKKDAEGGTNRGVEVILIVIAAEEPASGGKHTK